jgi:hypothetical protein
MIDLFNQKSKFLHKKSNFLNAEGISQYINVPDWNNIPCEELLIEIQKFKDSWIETYLKYAEAVGYSQEQVIDDTSQTNQLEVEFQKEIENAQTIYDTKCSRTFVDEVVPRDTAQPEPPQNVVTYPNFSNLKTDGEVVEGGGGGGADQCSCPDRDISNLGLILIGLGTILLVYNSKL